MSCNEWKEYELEDIIETFIDYRGRTPKKTNSGIPLITAKIVKQGRVNPATEFIKEEDYDGWMTRGIPLKGDVILTTEAPLGEVAQIKDTKKVALAQRIITLRGKVEIVDNTFLKYSLQSPIMQHRLFERASGTTVIGIKSSELKKVNINLPPLEEQKKIANVLSSLDDKIELNNEMNKTLEEMAQSIFKRWFVDFEFPNEDGEPYKSSGGEMVDSELGMIPKGWEVKSLGDIIDIHDSKRIPLSKNKREKMDKIYPYYGAASLMDYVDNYIFDGIYVLMGEDGTVIDENGYPILQYVWGKFWVNNHAHVLTGKNKISEEFIYVLLKKQNITASVTGAVQLKINQQNLKNIKIVLPKDEDLIYKYSEVIKYNFSKIRNNRDEIQRLSDLRDTLLPKLMSGEIKIN